MKRPYDKYMPEIVRQRAEARRVQPDGVCHPVKVTTRGPRHEEHYEYPWHLMKLGDFFLVPLRGRKPGPLSIRFRQIAARRDWELSVTKVNDSLRVCLTVLDVSKYKKAAGLQKSDGQWLDQRKVRYKRNKARPKSTEYVITAEINPPIHLAVDNTEAFAEDPTLQPGYDRDEVIKRRLAALGISQ